MTRIAVLFLLIVALLGGTEPNAATKRWWAHTVALANDRMEGRDTGSDGYNRAAEYVVKQFARLGLEPAGSLGYYQSVPLKATRLVAAQSLAVVVRGSVSTPVPWFRQINVTVRQGLPGTIDAPLVFVGTELGAIDVKGKVVVTLGTPRFIEGQRPYSAKIPDGAVATLTIPSTEGPEPTRWPVAYSLAMSIDAPDPLPARAAAAGSNVPAFTFNEANAELLFAGSGHSFAEVLGLAKSGKAAPSFELPSSLQVTIKAKSENPVSDNILAVMPGSDPELKKQYVVVSAHLDGYGIGEPWNGDAIYNGAFDDAAYVATLIDMAERLREAKTKLKRSILFCVFTGEEKGLLGSRYFAGHPTVAKEKMVANLNLDILRPIFPLKILTVLGMKDSPALGEAARKIAEPMGIRVQQDPEPLRGLIRRSDHYNFMQIGVPALGFVFGYENGTPEEAVYRRWYLERYHTPADDLKQPWVPEAAAKFNEFFQKLTEAVANAPQS